MILNTISSSLEQLSNGQITIGFMRHAARELIPPGDIGNNVRLTSEGIQETILLRELFKTNLVKIYTSPVLRCLETANLLCTVAKDPLVQTSNKLGNPGIFVEQPEIAAPVFMQYQDDPIKLALALIHKQKLSGFCLSSFNATQALIKYWFNLITEPGISVCITHDSILGVIIGTLFPQHCLYELWPNYLDTLFFQYDEDLLSVVYRGQKKLINNFP